MTERLFGTDGIRGRAGEGILAEEACLRLGRALGEFSRQRGLRPLAAVGHDGRRSAGMIEGALCAGLMASGIDPMKLGLITTPGLAYLARRNRSGLGIMISASHNPAEDNGIKVLGPGGRKLAEGEERAVEAIYERDPASPGASLGSCKPPRFPPADYLGYLAEKTVPRLRLRGWKIVIDCANGGASWAGPALLRELGARVVPMADRPDGENINRGCGAVHPEALARRVRREKARLGFALDGDGDRAIFADDRGEILDGDGALFILARDLARRRKLAKKTVVATVMSNLGLREALSALGLRLDLVPVGDRHVVEALRRGRLSLGGEQSGHIVFGSENDFVGDGLFTALRLLDVLRRSGEPLSRLRHPFRRFPQVLRNVPVVSKPPWEERPRILAAVRRAEERLGRSGRVLLRYSGTEPLARVMVEGSDAKEISRLASEIAEAVRRELA